MKEKRASLSGDDARLRVTGCRLIKSVERCALIFPTFHGAPATDTLGCMAGDGDEGGGVQACAPLPAHQTRTRQRGAN